MSTILNEAASKEFLVPFGIPFAPERNVDSVADAADAADVLGYPVVVKLGGDGIAHKTERGLVRLRLSDRGAVETAAQQLLDAATPSDGDVFLLVAPMLSGTRELICGLHHDEQFGMTIMLGVGGVLAEALGDVTIRLAPIAEADAHQMIDDLRTAALLGEFRGEPAVDRDAVVSVLLALSAAATSRPDVVSVDVNPLIIVNGQPVAVDALVEVA